MLQNWNGTATAFEFRVRRPALRKTLTQNMSYFSAPPSFELLIQQANHLQPYGIVERLKIHSHRKPTLASSTFMMPELQKNSHAQK